MIDWTKPLELIDGTHVRLFPNGPALPDSDGDYHIDVSDGDDRLWFVNPDGVEVKTGQPLIRNRVTVTPSPDWPADALYPLGAMVQKKGRANWRGRICGWYRTDQTSLGFAVESIYEPGSVQIYPQTALEPLV